MTDSLSFTSERYAPHRAWWRARLSALQEPFALGGPLRGEGGPPSWRGIERPLPAETAAAIQRLVRGDELGTFAVLLSATFALLERYTGQQTLAVIAPALEAGEAPRHLPLVQRHPSGGTVKDLLLRTRETVTGAYEHEAYPFERLLARELPLLEGPLSNVSLSFAPLHRQGTPAAADLRLGARREGGGLVLTLAYNERGYDAPFAEGALAHLERLLAGLGDVARKVDGLDCLSGEERERLTRAFALAPAGGPPDRTLVDCFEEQVARTPDAEALVQGERRLTYRELNARVNRLAHALRDEHGVRPDEPVGLFGEPSDGMIVALLAILKAGGAYVAMEGRTPAARLAAMARAARIRLLLVDESSPEVEGWFEGKGVRLDRAGRGAPEGNPPPVLHPRNLAYLMFTSGSTGEPKGVQIEHRAAALFAREANYSDLRPGVRIVQLSNLAFDASVYEIFGALLNGAALHVAPQAIRASVPELVRLIRAERINVASVTTAVFNQWVELEPESLRELDRLYFGGQEASPRHVHEAWLRRKREGSLVQCYGPTETTVFATFFPVAHARPEAAFVSIGRPVSGTSIYVLDPRMRPSPVGVEGEIYLGGPRLARGYLNQPGLTAERFVPDPFEPGGTLYRTGDRGCWLSSGDLRFLGRKDDLVKVRGHRIELGEIENALRRHPAVQEAAVVARALADGEKELLAYVQADPPPGVAALREHLAGTLPEYMIPARVLFVPKLALNANGKIDRKALPAPDAQDWARPADYVPPRTPTEARLAALWERLLERAPIGAGDDFLELGGHSLKVAQLSTLLHRELELKVPLVDIFLHPRLDALAAHLDALTRSRFAPISPTAPQADHPLSHAQRSLWLHHQMDPTGRAAYNVPERYALEGPLDTRALARALDALVRRHEALRTRFVAVSGEPRQRIEPAAPIALAEVDLRTYPDADAELEHEAAREAHAPFDLEAGPLLRAKLVRRADQRHELLLTLHHIVCDGWSAGVLLRELEELYRAFARGGEDPLPPPRLQYRDFARWQLEQLEGPQAAADRAWWHRELAELLPPLDLPTDRPRPDARSYAGAHHEVALGPELTAELRRLGLQSGATLFMALVAAVEVLLYRYTGQRELALGIPTAGRDHDDLAGMLGCFINPLVLRGRIEDGEGFAAVLGRVRERLLEANEHRAWPFDRLVDELQVERDPSRNAFFDVMVTLHDLALPGLGVGERRELAPGLAIERRAPVYNVSRFDLTFGFVDAGQDVRLHLEYSTELFQADRIERMSAHLTELLRSAVAAPERPVSRLRLLPAVEEARLRELAVGPRAGPRDATLLDRFREQVGARPDHPAVVCGQARLTYRELDERAGEVARRLRDELGVRPGDRVGLLAERSEWMVVGILGIWGAGAAYLPVDPAQPPAYVAGLLERSGVRVALTHGPRPALPPALAVVELSGLAPAGPAPRHRPTPDALAYVIHTSGSTGTPKGVMVEHRAIANWTLDQLEALEVGPGDRVLQFFSTSFDPSIFFSGLALCAGATLVIADRPAVEDTQRFAELIARERITVLGATPGYLTTLDPAALGPVRAIVTGGEAPSVKGVATYGRGRRYVNQFGPTEATCVTCFATGAIPPELEQVPVGRPISGVRVDVLDRNLEPVPLGVPGELYVSGEGLARGYLNDPGMTAERFLACPSGDGQRMYRTGDHVRWRADGDLEFLGRRDDQVKLRGYRIELGAIEAALERLAGVRRAQVLLHQDGAERRLVAYVEAEGLAPEDLERGLRAALPEHLVPARFLVLPRLPLTGNGKVDRAALRRLPLDERPAGREGGPPGGVESALLRIWAELMEDERLGVDDNFFEVGGNSLKATQLISRIQRELGVKLELRQVFTQPTLRALAAAVREHASSPYRPIEPAPAAEHHPLSHAQRRLWIFDQVSDERWVYNICGTFTLEHAVDAGALERAFTALVAHHEPLRTVIATVGGEPRQRVLPPEPFHLATLELREAPDREAQAQARIRREAIALFDLGRRPLLRATLISLAPDRHLLVVAMHHIVSDGWSIQLFARELGELYEAFRAGLDAELPELRIQYKDYAAWHQRLLEGPAGDRLKDWWHEQLRGPLPTLDLPTDFPRPRQRTYAGDVVGLELDAGLTRGLRRLSADAGASLFMTIFAGIAALAHRYTGQEDLVLGFPSAGRDHPDLEALLGFFINPLALRVRAHGPQPFLELLAAVKRACLGAYEHQLYPFDRLVEELAPDRAPNRAPLFDVGFTWATLDGTRAPGGELSRFQEAVSVAKNDLWFHAEDQGGTIRLDLEYSTELFRRETILRMAETLRGLLARAIEAPTTPLSGLPVEPAGAGEPELATRYSW